MANLSIINLLPANVPTWEHALNIEAGHTMLVNFFVLHKISLI